jgi:hypothetical protein
MADRDQRPTAVIDQSTEAASTACVEESATAPHRCRLFALLVCASALGAAAVLPYSIALLADGQTETATPLPALVAASVVQTSLLAAIAAACGLWLGPRVGLGAPMIRPSKAALAGRLVLAIVAGICVGA